MLLLKNGKVFPMDGKKRQSFRGDILIEDGKIKALGNDLNADGAEVIDVSGCTVIPGIIDAHCHIGMFEDSMGFEGDDGNEMCDPSTPEMRAIDAINPFDRCFEEALEGGVTTCVTGPGSANVVGGTFVAIKTCGKDVEDMILREPVAMKAAFGENPKRVYHHQKKIYTRMHVAAILRKTLVKAIEYDKKVKAAETDPEKKPERDLAMEAMLPVVRGELPLKIHAHRADDILTALRIAKEFGVKVTLDHCTDGWTIPGLLKQGIKETGAGVIIGPLLTDRSKIELKNKSFEAPRVLWENGIEFAMMTDHPVIPEQYLTVAAALSVREGLPEYEALKSITINPAKIVGIDDRVGSLEPGKDADIAVFNGDPLDSRVRCVVTIVNGEVCRNELDNRGITR